MLCYNITYYSITYTDIIFRFAGRAKALFYVTVMFRAISAIIPEQY